MPGKRISSAQKHDIISLHRRGADVDYIVSASNISERSVIRILEEAGFDLKRKKRVRTKKVVPASQSGLVNTPVTEEVPVSAAVPVIPTAQPDVPAPDLGYIAPEGGYVPPKEDLPLFKLEQHEQHAAFHEEAKTFPGTAPLVEGWIPPQRKMTIWERLKAYFSR